MRYYDFLYCLTKFISDNSNEPLIYLEIGVDTGNVFNRVAPLVKWAYAVDNRDIFRFIRHNKNLRWYNMPSDDFLSNLTDERFDVCFIDADHSFAQSKQDVDNIMTYMSDNGIVILHDTYPPNENYINEQRCGEVYKTAEYIKSKGIWEIITIPVDCGLSLIRKADRQLLWKK